mgnify:FL=1|tara:strand:+ start:2109 stop:2720 length:612 start_codon:yes stop_codon:yes gene_type:complete
MQILELFAGSCSFSNEAKKFGYQTITTDIKQNPDNTINYVTDIFNFNYQELPSIDVIWASPPCTYFSVASIGKHWNKDHTPKTKQALFGIEVIKKTIEIIDYIGPKYWIIENPRGKLRKLSIMQDLPRSTVTYCQYGESRMKPTDLWHNLPWTPRQICKNGMDCHESAPRGSQSGTQGLKGNYERSKVPSELCNEIINVIKGA